MSTQQSLHNKPERHHAVVIGGSMAGLLAARVLSDHFEQVTIVERDRLSNDADPRKGVPQGRHAHLLLAKGASILAELFPDLYPKLEQDGALLLNASDIAWYHFGVWKLQYPEPLQSSFESRPFLEQHVRGSLSARGNLQIIDACEVTKLCENHGHITGVSLRYRTEEQREQDLATDLVVDASGRGSRSPQWLASLGFGNVEESRLNIAVGYSTRIYRIPDQPPSGWKMLIVYGTPPNDKRGGYILPMEGGYWMVTLAGLAGDYPPDDEAGFLEYARSLAVPDLYEAIKDAKPVTSITTYKFNANRWRHYERMSCLPEGFIVMGDALCSFNPIYGQGMSVAAIEAATLDACLQDQQRRGTHKDMAAFTRRLQKSIAKVAKVPWMLTTGEDLRFPETEGKRPFGSHLLNWYTQRVNEVTAYNPMVALRFYKILHLLIPPTALFDPRIVWAVLKQELAVRRQKPAAPSITDEVVSPSLEPEMETVAR
jgi:2-polyprenyl-6-methoxyphenol hydroxylase-like FAD-dependent oxidoreductase